MGVALLLLLAFYHMQNLIHSEILETSPHNPNALTGQELSPKIGLVDNDDLFDAIDKNKMNLVPIFNNELDETELEFKYPIANIGIDYGRNVIKLKFQKVYPKYAYKYDPEYAEKRRSLEKNFMRFGKRAGEEFPPAGSILEDTGEDFEEAPFERQARSSVGGRDSRGDNFMRFGRAGRVLKENLMRLARSPKEDFMRFGRANDDFMRFGRSLKGDFMRLGRSPKEDFMRFGRGPNDDFMRLGRLAKDDFMRFGRSPKEDFMRFGRGTHEDFMRLGRNNKDDFMRFGRSPKEDFMRFGRSIKENSSRSKRSLKENIDDRFGRGTKEDFMRLGRNAENFMRFGRNPRFNLINTDDTNFMRLGRPSEDFMRFGRNPKQYYDNNFMRYGRRSDSFMRLGRTPPETTDKSANFMRFGKRSPLLKHEINDTAPLLPKHAIKEAAKMLKEEDTENSLEESNPMDKAIKVLYDKQRQENYELTEQNKNDPNDDAIYNEQQNYVF